MTDADSSKATCCQLSGTEESSQPCTEATIIPVKALLVLTTDEDEEDNIVNDDDNLDVDVVVSPSSTDVTTVNSELPLPTVDSST